ncbi:MAG: 2-octaprenyl-6-methoxyphenyl hydroxylase [Acidihalobacter sp.]|uniref:2-octaprenyl-6-methoxyphenyl hydroxylase n=1 Tax=Acidihalobacter sp. TaxID=1872108 RepID=UPI00307E128E
MEDAFDILIVGGGMVGGTLAAALAGGPWRVGVIEARPYGAPDQPSYDERNIALAYGSRRILEAVGMWPMISAEAAPITHIHVSDRGYFGAAHVDAREQGVPALGYVVANRLVGAALMPLLEAADAVELLAPAAVETAQDLGDEVEVRVNTSDGARLLRTRLLVAADGASSPVRQALGLTARTERYGQSAVIANVSVDRPRLGTAYERFTDSGPLALLPLGGERYSLVWTQREEAAAAVLEWSDADFLAALQERFGWRMGRFVAVGRRAAYPLLMVRAEQAWSGRTALVGNALHSLHPVAGQGFNLALRDVAALLEVLQDARDPGAAEGLNRYQRLREPDMARVIAFTDLLARLFAREAPLLGHLRATGLLAADWLAPLNRIMARQNMGLIGRPTHLGSGQEPAWHRT